MHPSVRVSWLPCVLPGCAGSGGRCGGAVCSVVHARPDQGCSCGPAAWPSAAPAAVVPASSARLRTFRDVAITLATCILHRCGKLTPHTQSVYTVCITHCKIYACCSNSHEHKLASCVSSRGVTIAQADRSPVRVRVHTCCKRI